MLECVSRKEREDGRTDLANPTRPSKGMKSLKLTFVRLCLFATRECVLRRELSAFLVRHAKCESGKLKPSNGDVVLDKGSRDSACAVFDRPFHSGVVVG